MVPVQTNAKNARTQIKASANGANRKGNPESRATKLATKLSEVVEEMPGSMDEKDVHKLRTTVRRVEVVLQDSGCVRGRAKLDQQLKALRKHAGKVRDLDVHLGMLEELDSNQQACDELRAYLKNKRAKQANKLEKILRDELDDGLKKRLKRVAEAVHRESPDSDRAEEQLASVRQRYVSMTEQIPEDGPALHQLRIDCKRLRYEVEALAPEEDTRASNVTEAHAAQLVEQLKRVQDEIGVWHDWLTLHDTVQKHLQGPHSTPLLSLLRTRTATHYHNARRIVAEIRSELKVTNIRRKPTQTAERAVRSQTLAG